ncbi:YadA-like family protein [Fusobacterium animalis]|uniref:YadA-like family protein n=2 Tax=Fusobacterium TaxID=848 RepID=UPI001C6E97F2|nr:YadA-like family protein [Fusobacterium animalis]QYR66641.1 YadA-like family protein [Fusobacterium animalis]
MKKSVSLKLIVFSFLLVGNTSAFSVPEIKEGSKTDSIIAGIDNIASEKWSSAFGHTNTASGEFSSAFGFWNKASREFSSAFGAYNTASEYASSAFGDGNTASGRESSAFGHLNLASGKNSLAFGNQYEVTGETSGAFGVGEHKGNGVYNYINEGNNSYMIGNFNKIASGSNDNFILGNKVSIGTGVQNSVVLGNGSASGGSNTVSVGSSSNKRKIVNVADGTADSDAATLGQVKNLIASGGSPDLTNDVNKLKTDMTNVKNDVSGLKTDMTNVKNDVSGLKTDMTNVKNDVSGLKTDMTNVKNDVSGLKNDMNNVKGRVGTLENDVSDLKAGMSNVKGKITNVEGKVNTLEGKVGNLETNIAGKADVDASNLTDANVAKWRNKLKIADGAVNSATGTGSTGLGVDNTVTGNYSTAVGYKNKVTGNKSGAFGDPNLVTGNGSYAFGNDNTIKGDNNFVFGNNVTIESTIQNSVALGNNSTVSSSNEVSVGSATLQRKITNVADGEVSATSTDAVTGRQLYKAMQNSTNIENLRSEVYEKIDNVKDEVREVGSLSAALAGLHPMQYDPKAPAQVMAALGQYKNKQSVAVGLSYYFNDRFMMSAGVALSGEKKTKSMANVGFTVKLGKGSGVAYDETPQYVVQNEVKRLTVENQDLKTKLNNQENKIEVQDNKIKEQDEKIKNLEEKLNRLLKTK